MEEHVMNERASIPKTGLSPERLGRLSSVLHSYVERGEIAGVVALIHRHGEEAAAWAIGWQDREAQLPIQRNTLFRLMSMTKPVTAVAALMLVEEGRIRLYDPVDAWLPELAHPMVMRDPDGSPEEVYPAPRSITLHDLLTYRLGIGWGTSSLWSRIFALMPYPPRLEQEERLDPDAWMARLGALPLVYEPGARWLYQVASDVLGVLIARITSLLLETVLRERIFEPLGMVDTSFWVPQEKRRRLAVLYAKAATGELTVVDHPQSTGWAEPPLFPSGGAGLVSTSDDYQRFGRMLLGKGKLDGMRLLSRKTVEAMTTDYLTPEQHSHPFFAFDRYDADRSGMWSNRGFGYGIAVRTRRIGLGPSVGSLSWPGAFGTLFLADPQEDLMATLLLQVASANPFYTQVGEDFFTLTYQAITD
jgi:CubicO group peptidase (beta-lactamase class C family)